MIIINTADEKIINLPENSAWELFSIYKEMGDKFDCRAEVFFPEGDNIVVITRWYAATEKEARHQTSEVRECIANSCTLPVKMCILDIEEIIIKTER